MTRTKLDTPAFADQSVDSRNIADGTIQAQDISGSITGTQLAGSISNDKLAYNKFTISGKEASLGASISVGVLVDWQAVTVADGSTQLTAEAGKGYFLDTNTGVIEVFLPSSPTRGDVIILVDYSGTFATNMAIINTGGQLIDSTSGPDFSLKTNNTIAELVYVDSNKGWQVILNQAAGTTPDAIVTSGGAYEPLIMATGGTLTTSGDFRIHTFTGDGNFVVSTSQPDSKVDYMVIAGGGGGGAGQDNNVSGGGGGAGGFRESSGAESGCYSTSPLGNSVPGLPVSSTTYPITVGGGGAGQTSCGCTNGSNGSNSVFSTITSTAGGGGGSHRGKQGSNGGSGGGGGTGTGPTAGPAGGGSGNTPPVSPAQGTNGGNAVNGTNNNTGVGGGTFNRAAGGGGGATAVGQAASTPNSGSGTTASGGDGGAGATSSITGSPVARAGGGGGGSNYGSCASGSGAAGGGDGGCGVPSNSPNINAHAADANSGSGGGGGGHGGPTSPVGPIADGGNGGKGLVVIRYKFQ